MNGFVGIWLFSSAKSSHKDTKKNFHFSVPKAGLSAETISAITGLTIEEIKRILENYQTK